MPIYEYLCPKCGSFDAIQGMNEKPLKAKPDCCEKNCPRKAERVISASAFHLKGGGWYKDGYGGTSGGSKTSTDSKSSSSTASSDSKPSSSTLKSRADKSSGGGESGGSSGGGGCGSGCKCH